MNTLKSITDLRRHFARNAHLVFEDTSRHGEERRRHPRIRFTHAPAHAAGELPYRLTDVSQAGFGFFTSRSLPPGTGLSLGGADGQRFAAEIVSSHGTSFETSFMGSDVRYQVHCKFLQELSIPAVAELLGGLSELTLAIAD